jgi:hypothetical protein
MVPVRTAADLAVCAVYKPPVAGNQERRDSQQMTQLLPAYVVLFLPPQVRRSRQVQTQSCRWRTRHLQQQQQQQQQRADRSVSPSTRLLSQGRTSAPWGLTLSELQANKCAVCCQPTPHLLLQTALHTAAEAGGRLTHLCLLAYLCTQMQGAPQLICLCA